MHSLLPADREQIRCRLPPLPLPHPPQPLVTSAATRFLPEPTPNPGRGARTGPGTPDNKTAMHHFIHKKPVTPTAGSPSLPAGFLLRSAAALTAALLTPPLCRAVGRSSEYHRHTGPEDSHLCNKVTIATQAGIIIDKLTKKGNGKSDDTGKSGAAGKARGAQLDDAPFTRPRTCGIRETNALFPRQRDTLVLCSSSFCLHLELGKRSRHYLYPPRGYAWSQVRAAELTAGLGPSIPYRKDVQIQQRQMTTRSNESFPPHRRYCRRHTALLCTGWEIEENSADGGANRCRMETAARHMQPLVKSARLQQRSKSNFLQQITSLSCPPPNMYVVKPGARGSVTFRCRTVCESPSLNARLPLRLAGDASCLAGRLPQESSEVGGWKRCWSCSVCCWTGQCGAFAHCSAGRGIPA